MNSISHYPDAFLLRAMSVIVSEFAPGGQPWTYEAYANHINPLNVEGKTRLELEIHSLWDKERAAERAADSVHKDRLTTDPIYAAECELECAERSRENRARDVAPHRRKLEEQDRTITKLEAKRLSAKHDPAAFAACCQELQHARCERERLELLAADANEWLLEAQRWVDGAHATLEALRSTSQAQASSAAE